MRKIVKWMIVFTILWAVLFSLSGCEVYKMQKNMNNYNKRVNNGQIK